MKRQSRILFIKVATWLLVEILLNCVGLDNLADYGEFALGRSLDQATPTLSSIVLIGR